MERPDYSTEGLWYSEVFNLHKGSFTNYVDTFLVFSDPPTLAGGHLPYSKGGCLFRPTTHLGCSCSLWCPPSYILFNWIESHSWIQFAKFFVHNCVEIGQTLPKNPTLCGYFLGITLLLNNQDQKFWSVTLKRMNKRNFKHWLQPEKNPPWFDNKP